MSQFNSPVNSTKPNETRDGNIAVGPPHPYAGFRLTYGIEIEYVLAHLKGSREDPFPQDSRKVSGPQFDSAKLINDDIKTHLEAAGIPTLNELDSKTLKLSDKEQMRCWALKIDDTVDQELQSEDEWRDDPYLYYGFEMSSPPYYYEGDTLGVVRRVVQVLRQNYRVKCNRTTGLHVHVGNGLHGFQPNVLRNILAIAWTYERQWQLMHSFERTQSNHARPLSSSRLRSILPPASTRLEFLNRILRYTDIKAMCHDLQGLDSRLAFSLRYLEPPFRGATKRTFGFRHHEGTLDPKAIAHWVRLCVKLVEKACRVKKEDEEDFFRKLREDCMKPVGKGEGRVSLYDFLWWIDCPAQAIYYELKLEMKGGGAAIRRRVKMQEEVERSWEESIERVIDGNSEVESSNSSDTSGKDGKEKRNCLSM
ncbi:amidoligase enzyme protein [Rutstroemia sp. NJR-2017a BVV2]|nr:amidoligase enzyme protein [Rutstroemia sp. NJR-2017a BVV2]